MEIETYENDQDELIVTLEEDDDPDSLRLENEELRNEIASLRSNLGKQNNDHGKVVTNVKTEADKRFEVMQAEIDKVKAERDKAMEDALLRSMSPGERDKYLSDKREKRIDELEEMIDSMKRSASERQYVESLRVYAENDGMPMEEFDDSTAENALLSYQSWVDRDTRQTIRELKRFKDDIRKEVLSELPNAVRATDGSRKIASGSPSPASPNKLTVEQQKVVDRFQEAVKRKHTENGRADMLKALYEAKRLGLDISYTP